MMASDTPHTPADKSMEDATLDLDSDDSDAVNTSSARIYFGPVRTPEIKRTTELAKKRKIAQGSNFKTPLRRSTRLSGAPVKHSVSKSETMQTDVEDENDDDEDEGQREKTARSTNGWPPREVDIPADEPSSALAGRIMRAHDNPSPPPAARGHSRHARSVGSDLPPDVSGDICMNQNASDASDEDPDFALNSVPNPMATLYPISNLNMDMESSPQLLDPPTDDTLDTESRANTSLPDLTSFDSLSTPSKLRPTATGASPSSSSKVPRLPSIDNLVFGSPVPSSNASVGVEVGSSVHGAESADIVDSLSGPQIMRTVVQDHQAQTEEQSQGETMSIEPSISGAHAKDEVVGPEGARDPSGNVEAASGGALGLALSEAMIPNPSIPNSTDVPWTNTGQAGETTAQHTRISPTPGIPHPEQLPISSDIQSSHAVELIRPEDVQSDTPPPDPLPSTSETAETPSAPAPATPVRRSVRLSSSPRRSIATLPAAQTPVQAQTALTTRSNALAFFKTPDRANQIKARARFGSAFPGPMEDVAQDSITRSRVNRKTERSDEDIVVDSEEERKARIETAVKEKERERRERRKKERELEAEKERTTRNEGISALKTETIVESGEKGKGTTGDPLPTATRDTRNDELSRQSTSSIFPPGTPRFTALRPPMPSALPADAPSSPRKFTNPLDDPNRSPARRVPMSEAIKSGMISPQKATQVKFDRANRSSPLPPPIFGSKKSRTGDGPKRIPIEKAFASTAWGASSSSSVRPSGGFGLFSSTAGVTRPSAFDRSRSVEPVMQASTQAQPQLRRPEKPASAPIAAPSAIIKRPSIFSTRSDGDAPFGTLTKGKAAMRPVRNPLPYPIIASIPEEESSSSRLTPPAEGQTSRPSNSEAKATSTLPVVKSSLKQPSAGSRIPRIGAKPYARPTLASMVREQPAKATTPRAITAGAGPVRTFRKATGRSQNAGSGSSSDSGEATSKLRGLSSQAIAGLKGAEVQPVSATDRKNAVVENSSTPASSITSPSLKRKREGTPTDCNATSAAHKTEPGISQMQADSSPEGDSMTIEQSVADEKERQANKQKTRAQRFAAVKDWKRTKEPEHTLQSSSDREDSDPSSPVSLPLTSQTPANQDAGEDASVSPSQATDEQSWSRGRRTSRRRPPSTSDDLFGVAAKASQSRGRSTGKWRMENSPFSGMSATALKSITSTNTDRNQHYRSADLTTQIIRKPGPRPESPTSKVRTIMQKQQEEKVKQRSERAERRARRAEGSDFEGISFMSEDPDEHVDPTKHRRGPGEDEDYVTPEKLDRAMKKAKFEKGEPKQVKWDRGLHKTVYLDDPKPEPRDLPADPKSCLSKSVKKLRLDTLGNVPNAQKPIENIIREKVVVKKFVYDNDSEPEEEVKPVKSKSKKTKNS